MTSPTTSYAQPFPKSGRLSYRTSQAEAHVKKPKKVNSEIRKQQNRIASRNYREKRKRKLQYLQQLIKDDSNDGQTPEPSPQQHQAHLRSRSIEFDTGPSSSPFMLPSSSDSMPVSSSSAATPGSVPLGSTVAYDTSHTSTQSCLPFETSWESHMYNSPSANAYASGWAPSIVYPSRVMPRQVDYQFSPSADQAAFRQTISPYLHPRDTAPAANTFFLGAPYGQYNESQSQTYNIPNYFISSQSHTHQQHIYV